MGIGIIVVGHSALNHTHSILGDEADEAELLAAALQEDSDAEDEDNSVTAI